MWYDLTKYKNYKNTLDHVSKKYVEVKSIEDMPKDTIGFIYYVKFTDGTKYIGKKYLYKTQSRKPLKNGKKRENSIQTTYKIKDGKRIAIDIIKYESDWKDYQGSAEECKSKTVESKWIIDYAYTKLQLTYLEVKYQFKYNVLEEDNYINDNILGKFYRGKIYGKINNKKTNKGDTP